ncbi:LuxR C-terminal-related transcriptional regulator, partial [Erysipelatoclostridium ramosum]|nr:LuxR C-terminal-related transcriptional regulator [Thomasclavelia ramosa]
NQLDSPNREIILLKFFEGFTLKEIALILDINENTIKTKMYRSLNELRSLLN